MQGCGAGKYKYLKVVFVLQKIKSVFSSSKKFSEKEFSLYKFIDVRAIASYNKVKSYSRVRFKSCYSRTWSNL